MSNTESQQRLVMLLANGIDCAALQGWLTEQAVGYEIEATTDADFALARCQRLRPRVVLIDPKVGSETYEKFTSLAATNHFDHVLLLDDRLHIGLVAKILSVSHVSYLTRTSGPQVLIAALKQMQHNRQRVFDPELESQLWQTPQGYAFRDGPHCPAAGMLSARELQIAEFLAQGFTVRQCAERLGISASTVDNHKTRLMRKVQVSKGPQLTRWAIREGVITA
ncbi:MAG: response regulator transcription factor [Lacipirellulaceae bacterium]